MNRFLSWLANPTGKKTLLEQKSSGGMVAIHAANSAVWSSLESSGHENGYRRNPVVYRCVRMISEAVASIPLKVCDSQVDCDQHPLLDLLQNPNEQQSGKGLLEAVCGYLLLSGDAYLVRSRLEEATRELYVLDPRKVSPVTDESGWPVAYDFQGSAGRTRYRSGTDAEILHISLFNPASDINGLSPISAAHMALDIHNSASAWNKALLDNSARPSGALVYASAGGDNLSEEQFERLKTELENGYSGADRAGRPMVLEGGLDWKAMGYSPRDMDFLQAKNGAAREIALAFGVPPMLLGIPGDNTYSNYQEANRAFWTQTVLPLAEKVTQDLGAWLGRESGNQITLHADTDNIPALSHDREAHWNRIGNADFLTANEKREALGFAPVEVGDGSYA